MIFGTIIFTGQNYWGGGGGGAQVPLVSATAFMYQKTTVDLHLIFLYLCISFCSVVTERLAEELRLELQIALALKSKFTDDQMRIDCSTAAIRSSGENVEAFLFYLTFFSSQKSQIQPLIHGLNHRGPLLHNIL